MPDIDVAKRDEGKNLQSHEETRASERYLKPPVDIIETADGLTVIVDIPGASKETVDINVDKGVLSVSAPVSRCMPGRPIYTEFELAQYYRQFAMPETLDHEKAKAEFNNGVLILRSPLAAAAKPRKIEIKAG